VPTSRQNIRIQEEIWIAESKGSRASVAFVRWCINNRPRTTGAASGDLPVGSRDLRRALITPPTPDFFVAANAAADKNLVSSTA